MRQQIRLITILTILCSVSITFADLNLKEFSLEPGYNKVTVRWEVQGEADLRGYELQRGLTDRDFSKVTFVKPSEASGPLKKYEYVDKSVFKQSTTGRSYYYRLKMVNTDGSAKFSKVEKVIPTISSARQTWGSIKAMFR